MNRWLKNNWLLVAILLVGAFLRLFRIGDYMTFLGDEGRDAMIVRNLLVHFDPILIGPGTSVGSMYLGPLYYYFMAPFLLLWNFSPIGPSIGVALLGIATIYLVYSIGSEWFSKRVGLIAAALYAISPTVIVYSRASWNPNIMPFFALLSIYSIWKVYKEKRYNWLIVTAISFAFVMQSHYLGVLLLPVLIIYWYRAYVPLKKSILSLAIFLFLMSPLALFDLRHDFLNSKALYKFLTVREETVSINPLSAIPKSYPILVQINKSLLTAKQELMSVIATLVITLTVITFLINKKLFIPNRSQLIVILLWLGFGLIGFGIYRQPVYDHYFGFLFPIPFLLTGLLLSRLYETKYKIFAIIIFVILVFVNLINNPFKKEPNRLMARSQKVASKVIQESKGERFNIAVIADMNYEDGYQYFLEKENAKIVEIDSQIPNTVTNQLFVICEKEKLKCDPTHSSKAEVANFGWSKIESEFEIEGVTIYKLIHVK